MQGIGRMDGVAVFYMVMATHHVRDRPAKPGTEIAEGGEILVAELAAAGVAAVPEVRAELVAFQRSFAKKKPGVVIDGRDIGTVIVPQADVKIYVTATPKSGRGGGSWSFRAGARLSMKRRRCSPTSSSATSAT